MVRGETASPPAEIVVAKGARRRSGSLEGRRVLSARRDRRDGWRCRLHGCICKESLKVVEASGFVWHDTAQRFQEMLSQVSRGTLEPRTRCSNQCFAGAQVSCRRTYS